MHLTNLIMFFGGEGGERGGGGVDMWFSSVEGVLSWIGTNNIWSKIGPTHSHLFILLHLDPSVNPLGSRDTRVSALCSRPTRLLDFELPLVLDLSVNPHKSIIPHISQFNIDAREGAVHSFKWSSSFGHRSSTKSRFLAHWIDGVACGGHNFSCTSNDWGLVNGVNIRALNGQLHVGSWVVVDFVWVPI